MNKNLIVYYSRKGYNYFGGKIEYLSEGNTFKVASKIKQLTGGDIFEIRTIKEYPDDYNETTEISKEELRNNARPEIFNLPVNIAGYNTIYIGYPNWWGTMPMALFTFLESADFRGKTLIPFCTHEGSGMGSSESDIRKLCPGSEVLKGIAIVGSTVSDTDEKIKIWLQNLNKQ